MECIFLKKEEAAFIEEKVANAINLRNQWKWKKQNTNKHAQQQTN